MNEVFRAAAELQAFCDAQGWRHAVIGGLAVLRWGEPREAVDVDLTLLTGFRAEARVVRLLLDRYQSRIREQLVPLLELKEAPELWDQFEKVRARAEG